MRVAAPSPLAFVACVIALLVAGCGGSSSSPNSTTSQKSVAIVARKIDGCTQRTRPVGTIKYSDWQFPDTLNYFQTTEAVSYETINGLFDSLYLFDNQAHVQPQMATAIPTKSNGGVKDGGKTIVVHLKKGLHWSNGSLITSQDVAFGWKIGMDAATGPYCSGSCDEITRIDTPDKYTAVMHLKQIFAPAVPSAMPPVWPHVWKGAWNNNPHAAAVKLAQSGSFNFENPSFPTNGAYQVTNFVKDDRITLRPMKYYAGMNCGGAVKNLIFSFYSSKPAMIAAAASGGTDLTQNYTTADLKDLQKSAGSAYKLYTDPGFNFEHMELNVDPTYNGKPNPLANVKVRLALALALDKEGLIRSALAVDPATAKKVIAWTPWVNTPGLVQPFTNKSINGQWDPIAGKYVQPGTPQAMAHAKTLLSQTPFAKGFPLSISTTTGNPTRQAEVQVAANNWNKLGINVSPDLVPATKLFADWNHGGPLNHGQFQIGLFTFTGSPEPDTFKYELESRYIDRTAKTHTPINENYSGIKDPLFDKEFVAGASTFDNATRQKAYSRIQEQLNKQSYWISLYFRPQVATASPNLLNFSNNPTSLGPTWNMYAWKAKQTS